MLSFLCEHCGKQLSVADSAAGRTGRCPGCGKLVEVPANWTDEGMALREDRPTAMPAAGTVSVSQPVPAGGRTAAAWPAAAPRPAAFPVPDAAPAVVPVQPEEFARKAGDFYRDVWPALWWPLRKLLSAMGLVLVLMLMWTASGSAFFLLAILSPWAALAVFVVLSTYVFGVLLSAMRNVLGATAVDLPDETGLGLEWRVVDAFRRSLCLLWVWWLLPMAAISFLLWPVHAARPLVGNSLWLAAAVLVSFPLPMALIGLSSDYEWSSLNVVRVFRGMGRTLGPYCVLWLFCLMLGLIYGTSAGLVASLDPWSLGLPLFSLPAFVGQQMLVFGLYMTGGLAAARAAGLFAAAHRGRLEFSI